MAWRVQRQERSDAFFSAHQIEGFAFGKQHLFYSSTTLSALSPAELSGKCQRWSAVAIPLLLCASDVCCSRSSDSRRRFSASFDSLRHE
jgi:hypothetical protein